MAAVLHRQEPMGWSLVAAAGIHLIVILAVGFDFLDPARQQRRQHSMEVIVLHQPQQPPERIDKPEFLAPITQEAGGEAGRPERPSVPRLAPPSPRPEQEFAREQTPGGRPEPQRPRPPPLATPKADAAAPPAPTQPRPQRPLTAAELFAARNQEIARLTAELERKSRAYSEMPRRRAISASTQEYKYAAYLEAWRKKVERIGNLNYPAEAKRRQLFGNLVLHVAVRADGTIERVRVLHSSGHKILDDAAVEIVHLAAPYAPFPQSIRDETDVLDITRTWQFLSSNRLGWEE